MWWSGLRGAVGLAMAMMVESDKGTHPLPLEIRSRIAFHVSGIAILTMVINGMTIKPLYQKLDVYIRAKHHQMLLHLWVQHILWQ